MYSEKIDKGTAENIVRVMHVVSKYQDLQYYFLTDHVCDALGLQHFYKFENPQKSVHNTTRLAMMLRHHRKVKNAPHVVVVCE